MSNFGGAKCTHFLAELVKSVKAATSTLLSHPSRL